MNQSMQVVDLQIAQIVQVLLLLAFNAYIAFLSRSQFSLEPRSMCQQENARIIVLDT